MWQCFKQTSGRVGARRSVTPHAISLPYDREDITLAIATVPLARGVRRVILLAIFVAALTACAVAIMIVLWPAPKRTHRLRLVTDADPHHRQLAEQIRDEGRSHQLDITVSVKDQGTLSALDDAETQSGDMVVLVVGGIKARDYQRVRLVTVLGREPLQVFVRRSELTRSGLSALRGKRVLVGPANSGAHRLALAVLDFVGLRPATTGGTGILRDESTVEQLLAALNRIAELTGDARQQAIGDLPDAAVILAPLPSPLAKRLVREFGYGLLPLPFAEAFCVERLSEPGPDGVRLDPSAMAPAMIPAYTFGGDPPVPPDPSPTLSAPLLLIAQENADADAMVGLLETVHDSPLKNVIKAPPPEAQVAYFPFHKGRELFDHRDDPWLSAATSAKLRSILGGAASFFSGFIALRSYLRLRKLHHFDKYSRELSRIELIARGQMADPNCPVEAEARRQHLDERLAALQSRIYQDFARGGIKGESLLVDLMTLINNTRESLNRPKEKGRSAVAPG